MYSPLLSYNHGNSSASSFCEKYHPHDDTKQPAKSSFFPLIQEDDDMRLARYHVVRCRCTLTEPEIMTACALVLACGIKARRRVHVVYIISQLLHVTSKSGVVIYG